MATINVKLSQSIVDKENRLVVFDINIPHESQKFSKDDKKIAIGFRLKS